MKTKKGKKKLILIILVVLTIALCFYAFVISSPREIFLTFFGGDEEKPLLENNDNINGIYKYSEPLDKYYQIYQGCHINSLDYKIVILNDKFYSYKSTCIATYYEGQGDTSDLKVEYNKLTQEFQAQYNNKTYIKTGETEIIPKENFYAQVDTISLESLKLILQETSWEGHKTSFRIKEKGKAYYETLVSSNDDNDGYTIKFYKPNDKDRTIIAEYVSESVDRVPEFYPNNSLIGVLLNNSTESKYSYTLQLFNSEGIAYYLENEFPITVNGETITLEEYNVYIVRDPKKSAFKLYLSKYHDYCTDDEDEIIYYEFEITYIHAKRNYSKPEFVGQRYAKDGCNITPPQEEEK